MGDVLWSVENLAQKLNVLKALNKKHLQDGYMETEGSQHYTGTMSVVET